MMLAKIKITALKKISKQAIEVPGSKSYTNRALLIAALAKGQSLLTNTLESDDTVYLRKALQKLGIKIKKIKNGYQIEGKNGKLCPTTKNNSIPTLYLGNAGTAIRFLTSALTFCAKTLPIRLTGDQRMHNRPIEDLLYGLRQLGAHIYCENFNQCPPVIIEGKALGGISKISGDKSSQYFSGLLIGSPYAKKNTRIEVVNRLVSKPYIDMTIELMRKFGIKVINKKYQHFFIKGNQFYHSTNYQVEADASNATYFAAIAAIHGAEITINNLSLSSSQADIGFYALLKKMGCTVKPITRKTDNGIIVKGPKKLKPLGIINLNHMPDGAMTVAILSALIKGKTIITGLETLRLKETDRLKALTTELNKIGCNTVETQTGLSIQGNPPKLHGATIETYNDHRMAMCFAVVGTKIPGIIIKNPSCVNKTYPGFWRDLKHIIA